MRIALALVLVTSLVPSFGYADSKAIKDAKLAVTVPDGWKLAVKDVGLSGESADKEVAVLAWSIDTVDAAASQKKIEAELYSMIFSPKWDKPTTGTGHDLKITYLVGTGKAKAGDVTIRAAVVGPTAKKKGLLVATVVRVDKLDAHKAEIEKILNSVQAAK
jgi:proline racemase